MSGPLSKRLKKNLNTLNADIAPNPNTGTTNLSGGSYWVKKKWGEDHVHLIRKKENRVPTNYDSLAALRAIREKINADCELERNHLNAEMTAAVSALKKQKLSASDQKEVTEWGLQEEKLRELNRQAEEKRQGLIKKFYAEQLVKKIAEEKEKAKEKKAAEAARLAAAKASDSSDDLKIPEQSVGAAKPLPPSEPKQEKKEEKEEEAFCLELLKIKQETDERDQKITELDSAIQKKLKTIQLGAEDKKAIDAIDDSFRPKFIQLRTRPRFTENTFLFGNGNHRITKKAEYTLGGFIRLVKEQENKRRKVSPKFNKLNREEAQQLVAQLLLAVEELHNAGFAHRDIKADNLLLKIFVLQNNKRIFKLELIDLEDVVQIDQQGRATIDYDIEVQTDQNGNVVSRTAHEISGYLGKTIISSYWNSTIQYRQALYDCTFENIPQPQKDEKTRKKVLPIVYTLPSIVERNLARSVDLGQNDCFGLGYTIQKLSEIVEDDPSKRQMEDLSSQLMSVDADKRLTLETAKQHPFFSSQSPQEVKSVEQSSLPTPPVFADVLAQREAFSDKAELAKRYGQQFANSHFLTLSNQISERHYTATAPKPGDAFYLWELEEQGSEKQEIIRLAQSLQEQIAVIEKFKNKNSVNHINNYATYVHMIVSIVQTKVLLQRAIDRITDSTDRQRSNYLVPKDISSLFSGFPSPDEKEKKDIESAEGVIAELIGFIKEYSSIESGWFKNRHTRLQNLIQLLEELVAATIPSDDVLSKDDTHDYDGARKILEQKADVKQTAPGFEVKENDSVQKQLAAALKRVENEYAVQKEKCNDNSYFGETLSKELAQLEEKLRNLTESKTAPDAKDTTRLAHLKELKELKQMKQDLATLRHHTAILPVLEKWKTEWTPGFFRVSSSGRCGEFVTKRINGLSDWLTSHRAKPKDHVPEEEKARVARAPSQ